jgi:hypothetical protein
LHASRRSLFVKLIVLPGGGAILPQRALIAQRSN